MPNHLVPGLHHPATPAAPPSGAPDESARHRGSTRYLNLFTLGLIVVLGAILSLPLALPGRVQLAEGQPAPSDIYAPQYFRYESTVLTNQDRANARNAAGPVYDYNGSLVESQRSRLNDLLTTIENIRGTGVAPDPSAAARLSQIPDVQLTPDDVTAVLDATPEAYSRLRYDVLRVFDNLMISGKIADTAQLDRQRADLPLLFTSELSLPERNAAADILSPFLVANLTLNQEKTTAAQDAAAAAVQPRIVEVQKGEIILRQGQIADAAAIEKLEKAGLRNPTVSAENAGAVFGSVLILLLLLHFYLLRLQPHVWSHQRSLMLLGLVLTAPTLLMRVTVPGHAVWPYMLPVAAASMLVAVLLDANLAIVITFVLGVFAALLTQGGFDLALFYVVGGMAAVFAIWRAERISTFVLSGVYVSAASLAAVLLLRVIENQHLDLNAIGVMAIAAAINGALSASLTFATFSVLGSMFGITTLLQLLELAHPTQPLLRRLMHEAPGTYHHSLVVSNLAEHAAERVGADPLLARVAAYYHDIGKLQNPHVFIENQSGMENIHDTLDPETSARMIRAHVPDGVALAQRSRLPRRIIDCIAQHHGTTGIQYFYRKALQADPTVQEADFRYPGPKPQTKEAAILMLADGVEATIRSVVQAGKLENPGPAVAGLEPPPNSLRGVIRRIFRERFEDGQLDECSLTIRDLREIEEAFYGMLNGIYHPRITYPEKPSPVAVPAAAAVLPAAAPPRRSFPLRRLPAAALAPANGLADGLMPAPVAAAPNLVAPIGVTPPEPEGAHAGPTDTA